MPNHEFLATQAAAIIGAQARPEKVLNPLHSPAGFSDSTGSKFIVCTIDPCTRSHYHVKRLKNAARRLAEKKKKEGGKRPKSMVVPLMKLCGVPVADCIEETHFHTPEQKSEPPCEFHPEREAALCEEKESASAVTIEDLQDDEKVANEKYLKELFGEQAELFVEAGTVVQELQAPKAETFAPLYPELHSTANLSLPSEEELKSSLSPSADEEVPPPPDIEVESSSSEEESSEEESSEEESTSESTGEFQAWWRREEAEEDWEPDSSVDASGEEESDGDEEVEDPRVALPPPPPPPPPEAPMFPDRENYRQLDPLGPDLFEAEPSSDSDEPLHINPLRIGCVAPDPEKDDPFRFTGLYYNPKEDMRQVKRVIYVNDAPGRRGWGERLKGFVADHLNLPGPFRRREELKTNRECTEDIEDVLDVGRASAKTIGRKGKKGWISDKVDPKVIHPLVDRGLCGSRTVWTFEAMSKHILDHKDLDSTTTNGDGQLSRNLRGMLCRAAREHPSHGAWKEKSRVYENTIMYVKNRILRRALIDAATEPTATSTRTKMDFRRRGRVLTKGIVQAPTAAIRSGRVQRRPL